MVLAEVSSKTASTEPGLKGKLNKVVLAYSGGLDTSVIVPWLRYACKFFFSMIFFCVVMFLLYLHYFMSCLVFCMSVNANVVCVCVLQRELWL